MYYLKLLEEYDDVLAPSDLQKILHVGKNTIYHYLSNGLIKSHMISGKYLIPKLYVLEFLYPDKDFAKLDIEEPED